jgi:tRNA modification GTPase
MVSREIRFPMYAPRKDRRTIYAPASGRGRSAVGIIRISGPASRAAIAALIGGSAPPARHAALKTLRNPATGEELDRGLVLWFPGPNSYTGEDAAELHVTGGRAVLAGVTAALAALDDLRPAEPGEFAWRAFENGKLDLSQVEGLADLVDAETQAQRRQALRIAGGALSREADAARADILGAMARIEAAIDFSDQEDVNDATVGQAKANAAAVAARLRETLSTADRGERLRDGFNVVIAGPPNVGKSTLLNALARRDVAIVSDIPGTTRDTLEVHLELRGLPVVLVDTAGIRETEDPIEKEGVARARRRTAEADIILWLSDGTTSGADAGTDLDAPHLLVRTKSDLALGGSGPAMIAISAKSGEGIEQLLDSIAGAAEEQLSGADQSLISATRHRAAFGEALANLQRAATANPETPELMAEDLRLAARALERIAGRIDVEDVLGEIFSRLCIGK